MPSPKALLLSIAILIAVSVPLFYLSTAFDLELTGADAKETALITYRYWNNDTKSHFYTTDQEEAEALSSAWKYEGTSWLVARPTSKTDPIHRFRNAGTSSYFYTIKKDEAQKLSGNWQYEGVAWYGYKKNKRGTTPVYRFYSEAYKKHFYTTNKDERDSIRENDTNWKYEGKVWYTPEREEEVPVMTTTPPVIPEIPETIPEVPEEEIPAPTTPAPETPSAALTITEERTGEVTETTARIIWDTNTNAQGQVHYGKTNTLGTFSTKEERLLPGHNQILKDLTPGTTYYYQVHASDTTGTTKGTIGTFRTLTPPVVIPPTECTDGIDNDNDGYLDLNDFDCANAEDNKESTDTPAPPTTPVPEPPVTPILSALSVHTITETSARISWTLSENATGYITYGTTDTYGSETARESRFLEGHSQIIQNLTPGTTYYYQVQGETATGTVITAPERSFVTAEGNTPTPPVTPPAEEETTITTPTPNTTLTGTSQAFTWSDGGNAERVYDFHAGSAEGGTDYLDTNGLGTTKEATVTNLPTDGSTVYVRLIWSDDGWATKDQKDFTYTVSGTPVVTTTVTPATNVLSDTEARITWDIPGGGTGQINYGTSTSLGTLSAKESRFLATHGQTLRNLTPNTTYYYKILGEQENGTEITSATQSFTTESTGTVTPPVVTPPTTPPVTPPAQPGAVGEGEIGGASGTSVCGNGVREPTEQCDDGNTSNGDSCNQYCSIVGVVNPNAYYVKTNGNDSNTGRSEAQAFRTFSKGVSALSAGDTLYVKAGNYGNQPLTVSKSGTASAPITIAGYQNTPGDNPRIVNFKHNTAHNANIMPLIGKTSRSASGRGITIGGNYVTVKNLQVTNLSSGASVTGNYSTLDNIIATKFGLPTAHYSGSGLRLYGHHNTIRNSVMVDAGGQGITISNSNNIVEFTKIYGTSAADDNGMDYFFIMRGLVDAPVNDNISRNNYMERIGQPSHVGHGFQVKGHGQRNVFENSTAVNMKGSGFVARHTGVKNNIYRNNTVVNGNGITARDGASNNLFENFTMKNTRYPLIFSNSIEDPLNTAKNGSVANTFRNFSIEDSWEVLFYLNGSGGAQQDAISEDNIIEDFTIFGDRGAKWVFVEDHKGQNNTFRNIDISSEISKGFGFSRYLNFNNADVTFENSTCTNCNFTLP